MSSAAFCRHDLVWLDPTWREALLAPLAPEDEAAVAGWVDRGRPAVVGRRVAGRPRADGPLGSGAALPGPGRRLGFQVSVRGGAPAGRPPLRLPRGDRPRAAASGGPSCSASTRPLLTRRHLRRVYGSLAWQHLTGEPYLRPGSDVDLLLACWEPGSSALGLRCSSSWEAHRGDGRLDAEVRAAGGRRRRLARAGPAPGAGAGEVGGRRGAAAASPRRSRPYAEELP